MQYNPFDSLVDKYENWFVENKTLFESEVLALKQVVPSDKKGLEIGVGTGIFSEPLGIKYGVDPSENMIEVARGRSLDVQVGVAENLPYDDASFDFAVFITSICFIDNPQKAVKEARRVLKHEGEIIFAIIDKGTAFGQFLEKNKEKSAFYKYARFFTVNEVVKLIEENGFTVTETYQTLENPAATAVEEPVKGHGTGSFVVIKGKKQQHQQEKSCFIVISIILY
ncbi:MAG: methyltransferase domain-containing protein [Prolixibacteraceae bacterium]|nr:methyltransferase domain-containing protein [Prolixibacteraceae bacterium]MBN2650225.1 methyltransferase domain-containing protein [Prolixibacteraceae bacterium]